jgi:hypothetical protein
MAMHHSKEKDEELHMQRTPLPAISEEKEPFGP